MYQRIKSVLIKLFFFEIGLFFPEGGLVNNFFLEQSSLLVDRSSLPVLSILFILYFLILSTALFNFLYRSESEQGLSHAFNAIYGVIPFFHYII